MKLAPKNKTLRKVLIAAAAATTLASAPAYAQWNAYTGPGSTVQPQWNYTPPQWSYTPPPVQQSYQDPTQTWQYRAIEKTAPVVKGIRDCAGGAVLGGLRGSAPGMAAGCLGGIYPNVSRFGAQDAY